MKKIFTLVALLFLYCNIWAVNDSIITWATSDSQARVQLFTEDVDITMNFFMEFNYEELMNFKYGATYTNKKITGIEKVLLHLDPAEVSNVSSLKIILKEGVNVAEARIVHTESVNLGVLVDNWNSITLDSIYPLKITTDENIYIGCEISFESKYIPLSVVNGSNYKQGWFTLEGEYYNAAVEIFYPTKMFAIRALAETEAAAGEEILLESLDIERHKIVGDSIEIKGVIKNLGVNALNSFKVSYKVNTVQSQEEEIVLSSPLSTGRTRTFTYPKKFALKDVHSYYFDVEISQPNGEEDSTFNNILPWVVQAYATKEPRVVLHEAFSSSTCGPCNAGNVNLKATLADADTSKWVCIKYQMYIPQPGDPYTTEEGVARSVYYGVSGVPHLVANGVPDGYKGSPNSYTVSKLNDLSEIPAVAKTSASAKIEDKKISFSATIDPVTNIVRPDNLRFFAAVVEKKTKKNVKTNGETEFFYVMKKFLTSEEGDPIDSLKIGDKRTLNYSYTFSGDYRLPADASDPINFDVEHSVENFEYLMVVYWIQHYDTKEVCQAGKADPNPHIDNISKVEDIKTNLNIYPNPLQGNTLFVDIDLNRTTSAQVSIHDMLGKEVLRLPVKSYSAGKQTISINISDISNGIYFVRFSTTEGTTSRKLIVTK